MFINLEGDKAWTRGMIVCSKLFPHIFMNHKEYIRQSLKQGDRLGYKSINANE